MKQCPTCYQPFDYELLKFCRFDGSPLISALPEEATTMLLRPAQRSDGNVQDEGRDKPSAHEEKSPGTAP